MLDQLTDRNFWTQYWASKSDLAISVGPKYLFHQLFDEIFRRHHFQNAIELGGFPGYYAIFLKKYFAVETTLFDYVIHQDALEKVLAKNNLTSLDIAIIEADLFGYHSKVIYDLVFSCGLIEHFTNTKEIIKSHLQFLKPNGVLLIILPNLVGLNGWIQRKFDPANYQKHHLHCMDLKFLASIADELELVNIQTKYFGFFSVWLENKYAKPLWLRIFVKAIWYAGKFLTRLFSFESKFLSPYIVLEAQKSNDTLQ